MALPTTFNKLISEASNSKLYSKLILQLNKDLVLANIDLEFNEATLPSSLKLVLQETLQHLLEHKFTDYLNLLYQVDVSEQKIRALDGNHIMMLSEAVTFLILQREWQKVWYKNQN